VVSRVAPAESKKLIASETKRLEDAQIASALRTNLLGDFLLNDYKLPPSDLVRIVLDSNTLDELVEAISPLAPSEVMRAELSSWLSEIRGIIEPEFLKLRNLISDLTSERTVKRRVRSTGKRT
jgi:hypothetical protein